MTGMRGIRSRWSVLRARFPRGAARAEAAALGLRGYARLVGDVQDLRRRMHELERDHALLAAHVATLTERSGAGRDEADSGALARARLSAIAAYEHRIAVLESSLGEGRHARERRLPVAGSRTSGERAERGR